MRNGRGTDRLPPEGAGDAINLSSVSNVPKAKIATKQALYALGQLHAELAGKLLARQQSRPHCGADRDLMMAREEEPT